MIYVIGDVGVEIVRSTPIKPGCIVPEQKQQQSQNFVNYSFERNLFYSPPGELFETFSYRYVFFYWFRSQKLGWRMLSTLWIKWRELRFIWTQNRGIFRLLRLFRGKSKGRIGVVLELLLFRGWRNFLLRMRLGSFSVYFFTWNFREFSEN